jgi:hypothetical protein
MEGLLIAGVKGRDGKGTQATFACLNVTRVEGSMLLLLQA